MTLRFVKTSILSSSDGIDFANEETVESDEVKQARLNNSNNNKPLYLQLQELKDKKQEEYDQNTKKLFAPPKELEEEDIEFFKELEDTQSSIREKQKELEQQEIAQFKLKQSGTNNKSNAQLYSAITSYKDRSNSNKSSNIKPTILKVKRKNNPSEDSRDNNNEDRGKLPRVEDSKDFPSSSTAAGSLSMLAAYDSDSD